MVDLCPVFKWWYDNRTEKGLFWSNMSSIWMVRTVLWLYHLNTGHPYCPAFRWIQCSGVQYSGGYVTTIDLCFSVAPVRPSTPFRCWSSKRNSSTNSGTFQSTYRSFNRQNSSNDHLREIFEQQIRKIWVRPKLYVYQTSANRGPKANHKPL